MKNIFIYIITALIIFFILVHFVTKEQLELLKGVTFFEVLISVIIALAMFYASGAQFSYLMKRTCNKKLSIIDEITFPISRNLWGYLLPFQGALAYTIAFIKFKYNVNLTKNFSINLYLVIFNLFFTGVIGLLYFIQADNNSLWFLTIAVLFILLPVAILISGKKIRITNYPKYPFLKFIFTKTGIIISEISDLLADIKASSVIFLFYMIHTILAVIWIYWAVQIFNVGINLIEVVLIAMVLKMSLIIKITPGNLGVEQLFYGSVFILIGHDPGMGVLLSLFNRMITILISFTIGVVFTVVNIKYLKFSKIKNDIETTKIEIENEI